jgi:ssDNA-binding Zn-finger/Zn-ribbon topoisomerase 1
MVATVPECPACGAPMRLSTSLSSTGPEQDWVCTDSTCPTVLSADQARALAVRDDVLGASVEALMRAPVTPQGGGGGNGRSRRQPKPGDREAMLARRERRYLDQEPAGGRDREGHVERCSHLIAGRIDDDLAADVAEVKEFFCLSDSALVRLGLVAYKVRLQHSGTPCPRCQFWVKEEEAHCPQCGWD